MIASLSVTRMASGQLRKTRFYGKGNVTICSCVQSELQFQTVYLV